MSITGDRHKSQSAPLRNSVKKKNLCERNVNTKCHREHAALQALSKYKIKIRKIKATYFKNNLFERGKVILPLSFSD